MKEKVEHFFNSFKNGVMLWMVSYFLLYAIGVYTGEVSIYNAEIMKLLDIRNFISQVVIAGLTYVALDVAFVYYFNNIVKIISLNIDSKRKVLKEIVAVVVIFLVVLPILYMAKEHNVINKIILKLMITLMILKTIIFCIAQMINTQIYNQKLQEKNKQ